MTQKKPAATTDAETTESAEDSETRYFLAR